MPLLQILARACCCSRSCSANARALIPLAAAFRACVEATSLDHTHLEVVPEYQGGMQVGSRASDVGHVGRFVWEELPPSTDAARSKASVRLVRLTVRLEHLE